MPRDETARLDLATFLRSMELGPGSLGGGELQNFRAVREGPRVFSAYELRDGTRIWIITETDRSVISPAARGVLKADHEQTMRVACRRSEAAAEAPPAPAPQRFRFSNRDAGSPARLRPAHDEIPRCALKRYRRVTKRADDE